MANGKAAAWLEISRPFSWTASVVPVLVGSALAWKDGSFSPPIFLAVLLASVTLQAATNVVNELYDVRNQVDTLDSPRASRALVEGRLTDREALWGGLLLFGVVVAIGLVLVALRGLPMLALGLVGVLGGYFYTAPPFQYKYRALGVPLVFLLMGPLMVIGAYYALSGSHSEQAVLASLPVGILFAAIWHANDVRDVEDDARTGFQTLSTLLGQVTAAHLYVAMIVAAYLVVLALAAARVLPIWSLVTLLVLPLALGAARKMERGVHVSGGTVYLARLDQATAQLHLLFGLLLALAFVLQRALG
jgi:1,4-dihydroxy-2-naphthoate polyprenyltransferase